MNLKMQLGGLIAHTRVGEGQLPGHTSKLVPRE